MKTSLFFIKTLLVTTLISTSSILATEIYMWKDAAGRTHYTQFPPVNPNTGDQNNQNRTLSNLTPSISDIPATSHTNQNTNISYEKKVPTYSFLIVQDTSQNLPIPSTLPNASPNEPITETAVTANISTPPEMSNNMLKPAEPEIPTNPFDPKMLKDAQCTLAQDNLKGLTGDAPVVIHNNQTGELQELTGAAKDAARAEAQKTVDFYCN